MSRVSTERRLWQCPGCGRNFRIPAGAASPRLCPECIAGEATVALNPPTGGKTAPAATNAASAEQHFVPVAAGSYPPTAGPTEAASVAESLRSISVHLESMSRSMRVVRRLVWGILLSSVLTVLIYGYLAYLGMNMLQQVTNPLGGEYNELFQPMQEYQRALQEALQE